MATAKKADLKVKINNFTGDDGKLIYPRAHFDYIDGKPTSYTPTAHSHTISEVTGLQTQLNSKLNLSGGTMTGPITMGSNNVTGNNSSIFQAGRIIATNSNTSAHGITSKGTRANMLYLMDGVTGGLAASLLDVDVKNTTTPQKRIAKIGIYGGATSGTGGTPSANYLWLSAVENNTYNVDATLKVDAQNRVGIAISGSGRPTQALDVGGKIRMRTATVDSDGADTVVTKGYMLGKIVSDTNNYLTSVTGSGNGTVTFNRQGLSPLTWDATHDHNSLYNTKTEITSLLAGKQDALGYTAVPTTRTIAGLDLTTNRTRDAILGVSTNGYYRRTGANTYDIRTVANLKSDLGLGSLAYLNSINLGEIAETTTYKRVSESEKTTWNAKQNALGYTAENAANKRTSIRTSGADDTKYVSELGVKTYVDGLIGSVYRPAGDWNANTNLPALANNTPANSGKVYRVSVAGTRFGFTFEVGDKIAFNESGVISKWDNVDDVVSVNGQTGRVNLTTDDITQGSNLYVSQSEKNTWNGKAASSHTHSYLPLTGGTLTGTLTGTTFVGALTGTASGNLTSSSTLSATKLSGAIPSAVTATTQSASDNSTKIATTAYVKSQGYTTNTGTVTSVSMTTPTGLSVTGSPITGSGTLALSLTSGYSIPTTANQTNWNTAHGWGNHASAGYLKSLSGAASTIASSNLTANRALISNGSGKVAVSSVTTSQLDKLLYVSAGESIATRTWVEDILDGEIPLSDLITSNPHFTVEITTISNIGVNFKFTNNSTSTITYIQYGSNSNYGNWINITLPPGNSITNTNLGGLKPFTSYNLYVRAYIGSVGYSTYIPFRTKLNDAVYGSGLYQSLAYWKGTSLLGYLNTDTYPNIDEIRYVKGVTSNIQTQLNGKQATVAGVTSTEIGYLDGVTSKIQTQLNNLSTGISQVFETSTPSYSISGGTIDTAYNRMVKFKISSSSYYYIFTGQATISSSTGTATITLPKALTDGCPIVSISGADSAGSGGDMIYSKMSTSSSTSTFTITHDYATTTKSRAVNFTVTGWASS